VVILKGTPHLWIADDQGILHWAGDTRALFGKNVDWGHQTEVTLEQIRGFRRGAPWLSTGLLKMGDPIYFAKWESNEQSPKLLQIQSITDVELFGIDGTNYGSLVMEQTAWERRFSFAVGTLARGVLAPAAPVAVAAVVATATPAAAPVSSGTQVSSGRTSDRFGFVQVTAEANPAKRYVARVTSSGPALKIDGSTSWSKIGNQITPFEVEIQISNGDRDLYTRTSSTARISATISKDGGQDGTLIVEIVETGPSSYISKEAPYSSSGGSTGSSGGSGGCGSRGGPGYRLPNGKCASWSD
jgi:hypothetical protein